MNQLTLFCVGLAICTAAAWVSAQPKAKSAPAAPPALAESISAKDWKATGEASVANDDLLKRDVTVVAAGKTLKLTTAAAPPGNYISEAFVRFPASETPARRGPSATLLCAAGQQSFSLALSPAGGTSYTLTILAATPEDPKPKARTIRIVPRFPLDKISPTWDEDFRVGIENDMTSLPKVSDRWLRLAIETRPDGVRLYQNQMLLAEYPNPGAAHESVTLSLVGEARVDALSVRPLPSGAAAYQPVPLDDLCNARGLVDPASLPGGGKETQLQNVPFVFPAASPQGDHVDLGKSLFRYRLAVGSARENSSPTSTWPSPFEQDPARLRLRVPNRAYQRVWVAAVAEANPNKTPILTVRFYKPEAGWAVDAATSIPTVSVLYGDGHSQRIEAKTPDGKPISLWIVPIDLNPAALASEFRGQDAIDVEITKEIKDFRAFPDPAWVDYFQGGLPSAVHLYAMTLELAPVSFIASGAGNGVCNVYESPDQPQWSVHLKNQTVADQSAKVSLEISDPYGQTSTDQQEKKLPAGKDAKITFEPKVGKFGLYTVKTTVATGASTQSRTNTFLLLPPNQRKATAQTTRWGIWEWNGTHKTNPDTKQNLRLLKMLGALMGSHVSYEQRKEFGIGPAAERIKAPTGNLADPETYKKAVDDISTQVAQLVKEHPDLEYISPFAEWSLSLRLTHGVPPAALGLPPYEYTDKEKDNYQRHFLIVKALSEATRKTAPKLKVLFGVCGGIYPVPFMEKGYPKDMVDGYGLDLPQFMRMPERQPRATEPSQLYLIKDAMKRHGYDDKQLVHFESYFPSSLPLTGGPRNSADIVVRTAALSLALGTDRFGRCWELYDSADYWGTQQYGSGGLMGRFPEFNPKPAAAAFATMTAMLDTAKYDGYVNTGSFSTFCLRFKDTDKLIYSLWTLRGSRPISLAVSQGAALTRIDENGNASPVTVDNGKAQLTLTPTPSWLIVTSGSVESARSLLTTYTDAPGKHQRPLSGFQSGWTASADSNVQYDTNSWDRVRTPGKLSFQPVDSPERSGKVVQATLAETPDNAPLIGWYGTYQPAQPIPIPGKARSLGLWVKGNSGWGRILYEITDAKGEVFQNVGTKDSWNCDDTHSWSYINFDGWRYMEFPLPGNAPGDDFREKDSVWWNNSADGIVQLPLKLTKIIVEMPAQVLYVNQFQPVKDRSIQFDDLIAVYDDEPSMTDAPVKLQLAAAGITKPKAGQAALPNPITELTEKGTADPTQILDLQPPAERSDGTQAIVSIKPVEGTKEYQVWVSAYPDGRGAQMLAKGPDPKLLVKGLKPEFPLYFFATHGQDSKQQSKPSPARRIVIKDEFPFK